MDQRRVLITGAGSGLGRALAFQFAERGWRVACADIRLERAQGTVKLITDFGVGAMALRVDVGDDASVEELRDQVLAAWDGVDVVINNAGVSSCGTVAQTKMDDWRWITNINLLGVVRGCRAFAPVMLEQGKGHIVNIASFAALAGAPGLASYSTIKAAVVALSESLRAELQPRGVQVSVVCPTFFQTNLLENFRGPDTRMKNVAAKLMKDAKESADDIAGAIFNGMQRGRFMIIPTAAERTRWRLKRFFPELYFRKMLAMIKQWDKSA
jgi:NAD(P)-dependent dehydrogenase (short-subunit alcohol dehydrogenase family)